MGLAAGYGVPGAAVERAFLEHGINYFYWVNRKPGMATALRSLARRDREKVIVAIQTYDHLGFFLKSSVEKALRELNIEYVDILFLGWFNRMPGERLLERALEAKSSGRVRFLGVTGHNRAFHGQLVNDADSPFDVLQIRYNAAHRGAEEEVFRSLPTVRPGITTYTATRWGQLLKKRKMPPGESPLSASDCYRFVLSHPAVDVCLAGPRTEEQMLQGLEALQKGPLTAGEMERVRRIGDHVHGRGAP